jgi:hypothetical protein
MMMMLLLLLHHFEKGKVAIVVHRMTHAAARDES